MNRTLTRPATPAAISVAAAQHAAHEDARKRAVMETLTSMWLSAPPGTRLAQLLANAGGDIFYLTDDDLVRHVKDYLRKVER